MFFLPLGVASLIVSLVVFAYTQSQGGTDATAVVSGQVLTGTMLYAIAALFAIAGVFFIVSAIMKTIRRIAASVALLAAVSGGGVAALVPDSVSSFQRENNCVVLDGNCIDPQRVMRPLMPR